MPIRSRKTRSIVLASILTIGLLIVLGLVTLIAGRVTGIEFSPTHFASRSFAFYEIPLVQLQVTPITRSDRTPPITNLLQSQNIITVPSGPPEQWQLVQITRGGSRTTPGDAEILTSRMNLGPGMFAAVPIPAAVVPAAPPAGVGPGGSLWETWTRDQPAAAAVFWPLVQRLAERDLYLLMPELFAIAETETDPQNLQTMLDTCLLQSYIELASDLIEAEQTTHAANVLADALSDFPGDAELLALQTQIDNLP